MKIYKRTILILVPEVLFILEVRFLAAFFFNWGHVCVAAPIEGALPIPIWRILTPGYDPLHMIGGSQRYSSTSRYFVSHQVHGKNRRGESDSNLQFSVSKPIR